MEIYRSKLLLIRLKKSDKMLLNIWVGLKTRQGDQCFLAPTRNIFIGYVVCYFALLSKMTSALLRDKTFFPYTLLFVATTPSLRREKQTHIHWHSIKKERKMHGNPLSARTFLVLLDMALRQRVHGVPFHMWNTSASLSLWCPKRKVELWNTNQRVKVWSWKMAKKKCNVQDLQT